MHLYFFLNPQLKSALKSGGAVNAVSVCAVVAPQVAKQINNENKDWDVKRISLKNRNPNMVTTISEVVSAAPCALHSILKGLSLVPAIGANNT
jgi:hypothetical protein